MSYSVDGSGVEHSPDTHDIMEYDLHKASAEGVIYGQGHAPSMQRWSLPDKDHVYMLETQPLPATCPPVHPAELLAYRILHRGSIHVEQFMQLVLQLPESGSKKRKCAQASTDHIRQMSFSVGAYTLGGLHGVMKATRSFPWVARLLAAVARGSCYNHVFSASPEYSPLHAIAKMEGSSRFHSSGSTPSGGTGFPAASKQMECIMSRPRISTPRLSPGSHKETKQSNVGQCLTGQSNSAKKVHVRTLIHTIIRAHPCRWLVVICNAHGPSISVSHPIMA